MLWHAPFSPSTAVLKGPRSGSTRLSIARDAIIFAVSRTARAGTRESSGSSAIIESVTLPAKFLMASQTASPPLRDACNVATRSQKPVADRSSCMRTTAASTTNAVVPTMQSTIFIQSTRSVSTHTAASIGRHIVLSCPYCPALNPGFDLPPTNALHKLSAPSQQAASLGD